MAALFFNSFKFGGKIENLAHRYRKSQNRLLKVCCVPATSAGLPRVSFFFFVVAVALYSTNQANKAGSMRC